jgi:hypothetical protein
MWPFSVIKQLKKENKRLSELLNKSIIDGITIQDISVGNGLNLTLAGSPLALFADSFGKQFFESGAINFLTMEFWHKESNEQFELTMQKTSGETMCNQLKRLKEELRQVNNA